MVVHVASTPSSGDKPRSMNRSCIQCRERKIKCDRLDPCNQCIAKGSADECKHELRKKRAKNKRPFPKRKSRLSIASSATARESSRPVSSWAEGSMTTTSQHSESGRTPSTSSGQIVTPNTSSSAHDFGYFASSAKDATARVASPSRLENQNNALEETDDESASDEDDSDRESTLQPDDRLHVLEASQLVPIYSAPHYRCPFALKDVYADWRAMSVDQRRSLITDVRDALPSLPQTLHLLHDVYVKRLHSLHGNVVHIPTVQVVLTELLDDSAFEQRERYAFGYITTALMVIFSALRFAPLDRTYTWARSGTAHPHVEPLGQKEIRQRQRKIFALVKRIQRFESTYTFGSIPELQTAILMLESGKGSRPFLDSLADCAIRSAMRMRIHRLGSFERLHHPSARPTQVMTGEMAVRCWWALVRRDWSQSSKHRTYRISSQQFNTRQPLNLFDDELMAIPCPRSHLRSTRTYVSYSYAMIDFALLTRTLVDQVNAQLDLDDGPESATGWGLASVYGQRLSAPQRHSLDQMVQSLIAAFPAHYSLEARYDDISMVDIERWLLHQRLFHHLLTLHLPLVSEATRPHGSLMYMASHILDIQDKVTDICTRLDNSYLKTLQTLRACLVLLLDLFFGEAPASISGLSRLMTRRKITAALDKIPIDVLSSTTKLCVQLVKLLMSLEERRYQGQLEPASLGEEGLSTPDQCGAVSPAAADLVTLDAAGLRNRWHSTCQLLDVLLNDGYWRSFRKKLLQLDHLIPEWLQKPVHEEGLSLQPVSLDPPSLPTVLSLPTGSYASEIERAFAADASQDALEPTANNGAPNFSLDPELFGDFDLAGFDAQQPQFDMDLLGHQDFEGYGNASQSIDFAKLLMEWRIDVPLS
ncbi:Zn(2)-C6 fungal-type DNA-binding domain protein [Kalmanozyma brasiliensis GHG001]|uniref:Zn(2)-C6 fungal-type domain-containing protein n=1 Tax=Kalmanozyma brasiliensis (strain GHG001) TaxID=1365824 RepID=V5EU87_KALBG|nr:Zn(2)-C6 fungal-type DNA-binding domain protein [Kalmanozyma brasiliensis GHG001]EST08930.1 Zn(2)-C6 fungal-type DNA-binding domain protein [Kalmanozyma brasiliensis GHG001]